MKPNLGYADRLDKHIAEGTLIRNNWSTWNKGRQHACLLAAMSPEVLRDSDATSCPATIMPQWFAFMTPLIDDLGSKKAWPNVVAKFANLARRWHVLSDFQWAQLRIQSIGDSFAFYRYLLIEDQQVIHKDSQQAKFLQEFVDLLRCQLNNSLAVCRPTFNAFVRRIEDQSGRLRDENDVRYLCYHANAIMKDESACDAFRKIAEVEFLNTERHFDKLIDQFLGRLEESIQNAEAGLK